ncbi:TRAP transporter large permease [Pseudochelatococcus lubricantis]|uniref:TRAP transporter large permease n=1 Tax=Pseudochelatococcus lubricantis TaxID=1538102 RepID=UPI0035F075A2
MIAIVVVLLLALLAVGMHVGVAMGLSAIVILWLEGLPLQAVAQNAFKSVNSYALVAVPFFILAGELMMRGRIAEVLVDLIGAVVRVIRGGLALTVMLGCIFFAAVSGSSVASAAAIGRSSVSILASDGYPKHFSAALVAVGGTLGLMIPPSLSFILIGSMVGLPIDRLFVAGILPGVLEAILLAITSTAIARRRGYGTQLERPDWLAFRRSIGPALPAVLFPILIVGTIYAGIFTPTEVAAVAALYAALLCLVVYRTTTLAGVWQSCKSAARSSAMIYLVVVGGALLAYVLTRIGFADQLITAAKAVNMQPWMFLIAVNLFLLLLGMFVDGISLIVLTAPTLFQMAPQFGVDPIHMAVILTANVEIATLTPPIGLNLFVMSGIARIPVEQVARGVMPFYGIRLVALLLLTFVPWFSLALVR